MRDMLDADEPYPLTAWSAQFDRIRTDLDSALRREEEVAVARRTPEQQRIWRRRWPSSGMLPTASSRSPATGRKTKRAPRSDCRCQSRQAALSTAVARLLVENNESEEQTAQRVQAIYDRVQRQVYWLLSATLRRDRADEPVPDSLQPPAVRRARIALGPAQRAGAAPDRDARVDAPSHLARAPR